METSSSETIRRPWSAEFIRGLKAVLALNPFAQQVYLGHRDHSHMVNLMGAVAHQDFESVWCPGRGGARVPLNSKLGGKEPVDGAQDDRAQPGVVQGHPAPPVSTGLGFTIENGLLIKGLKRGDK
ncbi:hypothetical protein GRJ2_002484100 [Grus japonensis]|uniref:Uncharacterized protein n=1 Tax=Grus japonensis TaxID=30415 RepID=A0ABC9XUH3_GRUJA